VASILLIDDDADLTHFLHGELEAHGHAVECLDRGEKGPDRLVQTPFDLVLLDNKMPGMSGIEFLTALRSRQIEVPVILMTGFSTSDTAIQAMNLGAFDYIIKPDNFQTLFQELTPLIRDALEITRPVRDVQVAGSAPSRTAEGPTLVIGKSRAMVKVCKDIGTFARSDNAVLIRGETGTGKELVARALHANSSRKGKPFVALNCAGIPDTLLESELFGYERGAFTGAEKLRKGKIEYANGGTLFLDEIGDMRFDLQVKLLRVLQERRIERVGGNDTIEVDVRLLSATHCDLEEAIREGKFRQDLYFRLNGVTLRLPTLQERLEDLPELVDYFLARAAESTGRQRPIVTEGALERLRCHNWPGNVRELENVISRAFWISRGPHILLSHIEFPTDSHDRSTTLTPEAEVLAAFQKAIVTAWDTNQPNLWPRLRDHLERELLKLALERCDGNQTQVAERLDMARNTVIKRMQAYELK
jgi:DNA-binding NtrC family response regulator